MHLLTTSSMHIGLYGTDYVAEYQHVLEWRPSAKLKVTLQEAGDRVTGEALPATKDEKKPMTFIDPRIHRELFGSSVSG
ncbi:hypothetical protein JWF83_25210 [Pantoea sp. B65]